MTEFLSEKDHNLMVFADKESRKHVRKLVNNFGVDFEPYVSVLSRVLTPIEMPVVVLSER